MYDVLAAFVGVLVLAAFAVASLYSAVALVTFVIYRWRVR